MTQETDWMIENLHYEIARVRRILRSKCLTPEEQEIAKGQLANYLDLRAELVRDKSASN